MFCFIISHFYFTAFGSYGSHNLIFFNHEVYMLSMSSLACVDLVTSVTLFFLCSLTLASVLKKFKLSRLSSLVYRVAVSHTYT